MMSLLKAELSELLQQKSECCLKCQHQLRKVDNMPVLRDTVFDIILSEMYQWMSG